MKTIITKNGLNLLQIRLNEKMEQLKQIRQEKAHAYSASGDGWHDNPGWIQLGQQEEMLNNEVNLLRQKIANAKIIDHTSGNADRVQIGSKVEYVITRRSLSQSLHQTVYIVGGGESDVKNKRITYDSPIGQALFNMQPGDEKEVELPGGTVTIKIKEISYE